MAPFVCPWWLGYFLVSPLRRYAHNPDRIVGSHIRPGMTVVDFGCGMGHFSLPMACMVGPKGRVVCLDIQPKMLAGLARRAAKASLTDRLDLRQAEPDGPGFVGLAGQVDFALAFFVVHEVPDSARLFRELANTLKAHGRLLLAEPILHVRKRAFLNTVATAEKIGFAVVDRPTIRRSRAVLLAPFTT